MTRDQALAIARALEAGHTVERALLAAGYSASTARRGTVSDRGSTTGFRVQRISPRCHPAVIFATRRLRASVEQQSGSRRPLSPDMLAMRAVGVGTTSAARLDRLALGLGHGLSIREAMLQAGYSPASARSGQVTLAGVRMSAARHPAVISRMTALWSTPDRGLAFIDPLPRPATRRQRAIPTAQLGQALRLYMEGTGPRSMEAVLLGAGYAKSTARAGRLSTAGGRKVPPMHHPVVCALTGSRVPAKNRKTGQKPGAPTVCRPSRPR